MAGEPQGESGGRIGAALARLVFANPLYPRTLDGPAPDHFLFQPRDAYTGSAAEADRLFQGRWRLAGQEAVEPGRAPWDIDAVGAGFLAAAHSFDWLNNFAAAGGEAARRQARALVANWIQRFGRYDARLWEPASSARRLAAWLMAAPFLLEGADAAFATGFRDALHRQARHLIRAARYLPLDGVEFDAGRALLLVALALPGRDGEFGSAMQLLKRGIAHEILADGGHASRNPERHYRRMTELAALNENLSAAARPAPEELRFALARMAPALRFLRLGDGALAQFNGGAEGDPEAIDFALERSGSRDRPPLSLFATGFERLSAGRTVLVLDAGAPRAGAGPAHAGPLSFELSVGRRRLFVNCGSIGRGDGEWARALAATAAHSTLTLNETNALPVDGAGIAEGATLRVAAERQDSDEGQSLGVSHDGYAHRYGLLHKRELFLARGGDLLTGRDALIGAGEQGLPFAVRFHLHPDAQAMLVQGGAAALIRLGGAGYRFRADGGELSLEDSVYAGRGQIERTQQLVLQGRVGGPETAALWSLERVQG